MHTCWNAVLILPCCSSLLIVSCDWCGSDVVGTGVAAPERSAISKCSVNVVCWLCRAVVTSCWTICRSWSTSIPWCLAAIQTTHDALSLCRNSKQTPDAAKSSHQNPCYFILSGFLHWWSDSMEFVTWRSQRPDAWFQTVLNSFSR